MDTGKSRKWIGVLEKEIMIGLIHVTLMLIAISVSPSESTDPTSYG
jgi:hypothetical protein